MHALAVFSASSTRTKIDGMARDMSESAAASPAFRAAVNKTLEAMKQDVEDLL